MKEFNKEDLEFHLPDSFKGLSKEYIIDCVFNESIQKKWRPTEGDVIVGCTGNVFVISGSHVLYPDLGGTVFFYGGHLCIKGRGCMMNDTACYTMNKGGKWMEAGEPNPDDLPTNLNHTSYQNYRFVPYPHETNRF